MCSIRLCRESLTDTRQAEWNRARASFFLFFPLQHRRTTRWNNFGPPGRQFEEQKALFICIPALTFFLGGEARSR